MLSDEKMIMNILPSISHFTDWISQGKYNIAILQELNLAITEINKAVFGYPVIEANKAAQYIEELINQEISQNEVLNEINNWSELITHVVTERLKSKNNVDKEFYKLMDYIKYIDFESILKQSVMNLENLRQNNEQLFNGLQSYFNSFSDLWGSLDINSGNYNAIENRIKELKEHMNDFTWLFERFTDYRSKSVLYGIIRNWLTFDVGALVDIKESLFKDYFDLDIIKCDENEVFIDIGAYIGDSTQDYIKTYGKYKKIFCYEISPDSMGRCQGALSEYHDIIFKNKGVGSSAKTLYFQRIGEDGSSNRVTENGEIPIDIVAIDDDIPERITFIKMDIEGAEQEAILGCKRHIEQEHPKLAICTYHKNEDIWKIPRMIDNMDSSYQFYMRYNGHMAVPSEYVLIGI